MKPSKKGRARRAKAKAEKVVTYSLRPEFAHLAIKGGEFAILKSFEPQNDEWPKEIRVKIRLPPRYHGVIFDYGVKP